MTIHDLEEQIRAAFPDQRFSGMVTHGCTCEECTDLEASLRHQSWTTISDETIESNYVGLPLLSDEALVAFLPAWLTRALFDLQDSDYPVREFTLYHLALYWDSKTEDASAHAKKTSQLQQLYGKMSPAQVLAVEQWLKFQKEHANINKWDHESIDAALDILRPIAGRTP
jgi:hypothetical protein